MKMHLLLAALAVTGCTSVPSAEDLEFEEQRLRWAPSDAIIPVAHAQPAPVPAPASESPSDAPAVRQPGQPWITVGPYDDTVVDSDDLGESGESALCPFDSYASGFPAVSSDGELLVESIRENNGASDGEEEAMTVAWHDVDGDAVDFAMTIYNGMEGSFREGYRHHCRALWTKAKANAERANRRLAEHQWTSLTPLEIFVHDPGQYDYDSQSREDILATPASRRPAELGYRAGQAFARIPNVAVLARTTVQWWGADDEFCDDAPHVREVWGDRDSGAVAVFLDHQSGGCLCYSATEVHTLRWPAEAFDAALREIQPREELDALEPGEV